MAEKVDRLTRVNVLLKQEIANALERGLITAPGMLVSVTGVNSSVDLRNATVSISIFGGKKASERQEVFDRLEAARRDIQQKLAKTLGFKHTPVLCFKLDKRIEQGDRVLELLSREETASAKKEGAE